MTVKLKSADMVCKFMVGNFLEINTFMIQFHSLSQH